VTNVQKTELTNLFVNVQMVLMTPKPRNAQNVKHNVKLALTKQKNVFFVLMDIQIHQHVRKFQKALNLQRLKMYQLDLLS
jgi:hypothetical protein